MQNIYPKNSQDPYITDGYGFLPTRQPKNPSFDLSGQQLDIEDIRRENAAEERRSRAGQRSLPPSSNTGGKLTEALTGYEVSFDWLRMSGPRSLRHNAVELLHKHLGVATYGKGRYFLNTGYRWGNGGVYFDADDGAQRDHCVVDITGELSQEMSMEDLVGVLESLLKLGFKACRLDIAVDLYDRPSLIDEMTESCVKGELCRARRFEPKYVRSGAQVTGHGCNVGVRGKDGSGRFLRVYDKSLQTKTSDQGTWVRWEAELADDCAQEAAMAIVESDQMLTTSVSLAFGVCDFRENTGSQHVERRPRVEWYEKLLGEIQPSRVVKSRSRSTLHSLKRWMQTAVFPKLETLSVVSGYRLDQLIYTLFGVSKPDPEHIEDHKVRALLIELGGSPDDAHRQLENNRMVMITAGAV